MATMIRVLNGRIPGYLLVSVPWDRAKLVAWDVLASLVALNRAFFEAFGENLIVNEGYRDYATQVEYKARTYLPPTDPRRLGSAATPGTSVHGWGLAVDLGRLGGFTGAKYLWLVRNAGRFRFFHPAQYGQGSRTPEPWHWEYVAYRPADQVPAPSSIPAPPTPIEEDDMSDALLTNLINAVTTLTEVVGRLETKLKRQDLVRVFFRTPDGKPAVADIRDGWWAIAPSEHVWTNHRSILRWAGLDVPGYTIMEWDEFREKNMHIGPNGDLVADPESFGPQIDWPAYPGGETE